MHWRRRAFALFVCLLATGGAVEALRHWRSANSAEAVERRAGLDCRIAELDWDETTLRSAVNKLRRLTGARIEISADVLSDGEMSRAMTFTWPPRVPWRLHARLRNVTLSSALDLLAHAAQTRYGGHAVYEVRPDGTIVLRSDLSAERIVRIYAVRDLFTSPTARPAGGDPLDIALGWAADPGLGSSLSMSGRLAYVATRPEHARIAAALASLRGEAAPPGSDDQAVVALAHPVGPVHPRAVALAEVIDGLAVQTGINIVLDWPAFARYSPELDSTTPVTIDLERLPLGTALNALLRDGGFPARPTFATHQNILFVTVGWPSIGWRELRAYDIGGIIAAFSDRFRAQATRSGSPAEATTADYRDEAVTFVQDLGRPYATADAARLGGAYAGRMVLSGDRLLVVATAETHRELQRLFDALRDFARESDGNRPARPRCLSGGEDVFAPLDKPVKEIAIDQAPLPTALQSLQSAAGVTIGLDLPLSRPGFQLGKPVTLHMWNVPLRVALREVLRAAAGTKPLGYFIDHGAIIVTANPLQWSLTRIYDVHDLADGPAAAARLVSIIQASVDSPNWTDNGGALQRFRPLGGWLIVTQTPENHIKIESLLDAIRKGEGR